MAHETDIVNVLNSSAANNTVRKWATMPVGGRLDIQEKALTDVPIIRTMSMEPSYRGQVQLSARVFFSRPLTAA